MFVGFTVCCVLHMHLHLHTVDAHFVCAFLWICLCENNNHYLYDYTALLLVSPVSGIDDRNVCK